MPSYVPPKKNDSNGFIFYVSLKSQANIKVMQANPTLAAGDVKIAIDDGAPANLGTLPAVDADFTKRVKVVLSQAEVNGDNLTIIFSDAAGDEWCDLAINIQTSGQTFNETDTLVDTLIARLTAARAGYLDNLSAGAVALASALVTAQADLDNPNQYKADVTALALEATLTAIKGATWAAATDTLEKIRDAITVAQTDLDNPDQYKADVSALALEATAQDIKAKTANLPSDPADESLLEAAISTTESNIRGADSDDLKDLSDQLDTAQADLDSPAQYKADVNALALEATVEDLITRTKGLNAIYDSVALRGLEATLTAIKGSGFVTTEDSLRVIRQYIDEIESGVKPTPKANFTV